VAQREGGVTALRRQSQHGALLTNEIVYAELSGRYNSRRALDAAIDELELDFEWLSKLALCIAGQTFGNYRRAGSIRTSILADFFIGAHASAARIPILTRPIGAHRSTINSA
jgi:predicted nucleic acid-binding protein